MVTTSSTCQNGAGLCKHLIHDRCLQSCTFVNVTAYKAEPADNLQAQGLPMVRGLHEQDCSSKMRLPDAAIQSIPPTFGMRPMLTHQVSMFHCLLHMLQAELWPCALR